MSRARLFAIHAVLVCTAALTLLPFAFVVNNALRDNFEYNRSFFGPPQAFVGLAQAGWRQATGDDRPLSVQLESGEVRSMTRGEVATHYWDKLTLGIRRAWTVLRPYLFNSFVVSGLTALGVAALGSGTAYLLARYRFLGRDFIFGFILATMVFPGVLTLVPSFLLVKQLGLLNTYWAMVLPYVAGGQVFAIFVFRSFFTGLPEELFESARLDGAGHWGLYWNIVLPLSRPVFSVVLIMNILGTWNNFLWPFIVNTNDQHQVVASGLYTMARSGVASSSSTMYAAYLLSSIPLLLLFIYATKPFIRGMTSGAVKL
ncbi:MAG: carbohydrate ABC transporter permease [Opitutaceae bacterium]|nr:carbohydrate ABC transporter permease [Opitutaceae bacterium]